MKYKKNEPSASQTLSSGNLEGPLKMATVRGDTKVHVLKWQNLPILPSSSYITQSVGKRSTVFVDNCSTLFSKFFGSSLMVDVEWNCTLHSFLKATRYR